MPKAQSHATFVALVYKEANHYMICYSVWLVPWLLCVYVETRQRIYQTTEAVDYYFKL